MPQQFTPQALRFLSSLARHNDRDWFNQRKPTYEQRLKAPMLALIEELNGQLETFAPAHVRPPHKSMLRIYRDIRFSSDKRPYKTHLAAWWARTGLEKTSGAGFYLQIGPEGVLVAAGCYMPERDQLLAIRRHLAQHHTRYETLMSRPAIRKNLTPFEGQPLTRLPKGFSGLAGTPAETLILQRQWGLSATLPAETALNPSLADTITRHFRLAAPLVDLLNEPLAPAERPVPRLF